MAKKQKPNTKRRIRNTKGKFARSKGTPRRNAMIALSVYTFAIALGVAHISENWNRDKAILEALQVCLEGECAHAPEKPATLFTPRQIAKKRIPVPPIMPEWLVENREFNAQLEEALENGNE